MATLTSYFNDLISEIRPTEAQRKNLQDAHQRFRERLLADEHLKSMIVSVFLQGSYRRATAIRPQGDDKLDVDMVVVTRLRHEDFPNPRRRDGPIRAVHGQALQGEVGEEGPINRN